MVSSGNKGYKVTAYLQAGRNPKAAASEQPHEALANMRDDVAAQWAFHDRWGTLYHEQSATPAQFEAMRSAQMPPPALSLELRDNLRKAWRGDEPSIDFIELSAGLYMRFAWVFKPRRVELVPEDLWSTICVLFLRDRAAGRIAICANPDCDIPYFIKKRKTQKYCVAGSCTEQAQREQKRLWWIWNMGKGAR